MGKESPLNFLKVRVEVGEGLFCDKMTLQRELVHKLSHKLAQGIGVTPGVKLVKPHAIHRDQEISPLVVDLRS